MKGKYASDYFDRKGRLLNIRNLKIWKLEDVLIEKNKFHEKDAKEIAAFLLPMLNPNHKTRATATQCLEHPWLQERNSKKEDKDTK